MRFLWLFLVSELAAATIAVTNASDSGPGSFRQALTDASSGDTIRFNSGLGTITLLSNLPVITNNLTINTTSGTQTINGNHFRAFAIGDISTSPTLSISNLRITDAQAQGGNGGDSLDSGGGGGGGLGAGGAFFVKGNVTLTSLILQNNAAIGGGGGESNVLFGSGGGSGGGGASWSSSPVNGASESGGIGGNGGGDNAGVGATPGNAGGSGSFGGGGGGGGVSTGRAPFVALPGGNGGYGGGGGSAGSEAGVGDGGFGGGGAGGSNASSTDIGGSGGLYGGNGAGGSRNRNGGGGGGGGGVGGAIFIDDNSSVTLTSVAINGNTVIGGAKGGLGNEATPGIGFAPAIFLATNASVILDGFVAVNFPIDSDSSLIDGGVIKIGSGTATISSTNTYTGLTHIIQGTLSFANSGIVVGDVLVDSSATLTGTGHIGGDVTVNGTISPGNPIGTMAIEGDLNLTSLSTTTIEIAENNNNSLIDVAGTSTIGGALVVVPQPVTYHLGDEYTILIGNPIDHSTEFTFIPPPGFLFEVDYSSTTVRLTITDLFLAISTEGLSGNRLVLANYFNDLEVTELIGPYVLLNQFSGTTLKQALDTISPSRNSFTTYVSQNVLLDLSDYVEGQLKKERFLHNRKENSKTLLSLEALEDHQLLASLKLCQLDIKRSKKNTSQSTLKKPAYDIWIAGFGDFANQKAALQNPEFTATSGGVLIGIERMDWEYGLVGIASGYASSSLMQADLFGEGSFNGGYLTAYGQTYLGDFFIEGAFWGGYQRISNERHVFFPGFDGKAKSSHDSYQIDPHLAFGYEGNLGPATLEPFAGIDWVINFERGFTEKGASPFSMKEPSKTSSMIRAEVGLNAIVGFTVDQGIFLLKGKGSYVRKELLHTGRVSAALVGVPSSFTVESLAKSQNLGTGNLELIWQSVSGGYFSALYTGEFGSGYVSNQITARLGKRF